MTDLVPPCPPPLAKRGPAAWLGERSWPPVLPALVVYAGVCLCFVDYVPIWDGRIYFDCLQAAVERGWFASGYDCAQHPTTLYMWLLGLALRVHPDSYAPIIVANVLLGWLAIVAFYRLALVLAGPDGRALAAVATLAFAVHPAVTASTVQLTPDFGVLVFTLLAVEAFSRDKPGLAAVWSVPAVFSKESGLLLAVLGAAVYAVLFVTRRPGALADKRRAALRALPLLVPPLLYAGRALLRLLYPGVVQGPWDAPGQASLLRQFLSFSFLDNAFPAALVTILVLNYAWVAALPIALSCARALGRLLMGAVPEPRSTADRLVTALFVGALLLLTRFKTFDNVRYYLPVFPLLLLVSMRSLSALRLTAKARTAFMGLIAAAFLTSNLRTTDPVSIATFGSFDFGTHRLLRMTSLTGECCGFGRDQLVYNLEFTQFHYLQDQLFAELKSAPNVGFACHTLADFYLVGPLDPATGQRTTRRGSARKLPLLTLKSLDSLLEQPQAVRYIDYPNFDGQERATWLSRYQVAGSRPYERGGYRLQVYDLIERPLAEEPTQPAEGSSPGAR